MVLLGEVCGDVDPQVLNAVYPLHSRSLDGDGVLSQSLPPEVHYQLLGLVCVESKVVFLAVLSQAVDLTLVGRLVSISDQADHCHVIGELHHCRSCV